jgi:hypothetical protein
MYRKHQINELAHMQGMGIFLVPAIDFIISILTAAVHQLVGGPHDGQALC